MTSIDTAVAPVQKARFARVPAISVFAAVLLGVLLSALDRTIVSIAMPHIAAQLHGLYSYAWVFCAYMLAEMASMPIWGKLSDRYGRKWCYLGGMALFLLGSGLAGAAQSMPQLILFRLLQGLGAGAMLPIGLAIIGDLFVDRVKYQTLLISVYGLASICGPLLGGSITGYWGWRWVFYLNLPIGALALAVVLLWLRRSTTVSESIDYRGISLLAAGTLALLLAFSWASSTERVAAAAGPWHAALRNGGLWAVCAGRTARRRTDPSAGAVLI